MSASEIQKTRIINELRGFIRKLLQAPASVRSVSDRLLHL